MTDLRNELNPQQYEAATLKDGYACIIAGAGSGKTRTLMYRVACLIENGVAPEQILAMTFTNKAADEMKQRACALLDERCARITACTYHSFCARVLRQYARTLGLEPGFNILPPQDIRDILKSIRLSLKYTTRDFPKDAVTASLFSASINRGVPVEILAKSGDFKNCNLHVIELLKMQEKYAEYKKERNLLDYDDLLVYMLELLEKHDYARNQLSDMYRYIMIDEYQDTNQLQEKIGLLLAQKYGNLMVVGDYGQSLYAFRGADVRNIIEFPNKVPGCKVISLFENYRSTNNIVRLANAIIAQTTETTPLQMHGQKWADNNPILKVVPGQMQEAEAVEDMLLGMASGGQSLGDVAVLFRSSRSVGMLESLLTKDGIAYQKFGGLKFMERQHIRDVLAHLRILANNKDRVSWTRVLALQEGIGNSFSNAIADLCEKTGKEGLIRNKYVKRAFYKNLVALYKFLDSLDTGMVEETVQAVSEYYHETVSHSIDIMRTDEYTRREKREELERSMTDISVLCDFAKGYKSINAFTDDLSLEAKNPVEGQDGCLTLSTIHSAKGLEWGTVIILDCVDTVFPSTCAEDIGSKSDNEELRCMYVAVTRAKDNLYMFAPENKAGYSGIYEPVPVSHFLTRIKEPIYGIERRAYSA